VAPTIRLVKARERLRRLVDELTDAEANETLRTLRASSACAEKRNTVGRAIAEGYERIPQTAEEDAWALANAREAIRDEPW
jgi:hypothetical protein